LDASALAKLYISEAGTEFMIEQAHPDSGHRLTILSLSRVELRSAIRRRTREADLSDEQAQQLLDDFGRHLADIFLVQPVNETVIEHASTIVDRYALRAYDAVQLAGALVTGASLDDMAKLRFICADAALLMAAKSEGLVAINPSDHH
jgi:hypothetical protein